VPVALSVAQGGGLPKSDGDILNYALTLECLEAAFYAEAVYKGALNGDAARFAQVVAQHEAAHVQALQKTLGDKAVKKPSFDFKGTTSDQAKFIETAITFEDTGVASPLRVRRGRRARLRRRRPAARRPARRRPDLAARHRRPLPAAQARFDVGRAHAPHPRDESVTVHARHRAIVVYRSRHEARRGRRTLHGLVVEGHSIPLVFLQISTATGCTSGCQGVPTGRPAGCAAAT
jgi:Ferritin-like domain